MATFWRASKLFHGASHSLELKLANKEVFFQYIISLILMCEYWLSYHFTCVYRNTSLPLAYPPHPVFLETWHPFLPPKIPPNSQTPLPLPDSRSPVSTLIAPRYPSMLGSSCHGYHSKLSKLWVHYFQHKFFPGNQKYCFLCIDLEWHGKVFLWIQIEHTMNITVA